MSFVSEQVNPVKWRVYDPDRGIELVSLGGSSDDTRHFRLVSKFDDAKFSGRRDIKTENISFGRNERHIETIIIWTLSAATYLFQYGPSDHEKISLRVLAEEAFQLYGFNGHVTTDSSVLVSFS